MQLPKEQRSPIVHGLPSSQPTVLFELRHAPALSQKSVVQRRLSLHTRGVPLHAPAAH
jgi:hypothetical protein